MRWKINYVVRVINLSVMAVVVVMCTPAKGGMLHWVNVLPRKQFYPYYMYKGIVDIPTSGSDRSAEFGQNFEDFSWIIKLVILYLAYRQTLIVICSRISRSNTLILTVRI